MAEATITTAPGINRREFLYYIWGASLALFTAEFTGLLVWFMIPRFREGEFGGKFAVDIATLPAVNTAPVSYTDGRFWLVQVDTDQANELMYASEEDPSEGIKGLLAIYKVCTHLGCIYAWVPVNNRFECPCHGSKYRLDGRRIQDPAPRDLDRFKVEVWDAENQLLASSPEVDGAWGPVDISGLSNIARITVDTGSSKKGKSLELLNVE